MNISYMLVIALGAAIGANVRYTVSLWAIDHLGPIYPYGTLIVNLVGCFLIGIVLELISTRLPLTTAWRLFLVTGILGGLTTFSSFSYEAYSLYQQGMRLPALIYAGGSVALGIVCVTAGAALVRLLP